MKEIESLSGISILNDPFQKDKVIEVMFYFFGKTNYIAWVKFQNGNTEGKQNFKGESFDDLAQQMKAFIDTL